MTGHSRGSFSAITSTRDITVDERCTSRSMDSFRNDGSVARIPLENPASDDLMSLSKINGRISLTPSL